MTLTIDLTPEQEAALQAEATSRGLALPEFVKLSALENVPVKQAASVRTPAQILAEWKQEGCLGLFSNRPEDSTEIARQLRETAWKRAC